MMPTFRSAFAIVTFTVATLAAPSALFAQTAAPPVKGPWLGVWKSSPEKTTAVNNRPAPTTTPQAVSIFQMVPVGDDAFYYTIATVPAGGGPARVGAACLGRFDGKEYMEIGNAGADSNKFRIVDANTYEVIDVKDGKETTKILVSISPDGKTRTSRSTRRNAQGQETTTISIRERVE